MSALPSSIRSNFHKKCKDSGTSRADSLEPVTRSTGASGAHAATETAAAAPLHVLSDPSWIPALQPSSETHGKKYRQLYFAEK